MKYIEAICIAIVIVGLLIALVFQFKSVYSPDMNAGLDESLVSDMRDWVYQGDDSTGAEPDYPSVFSYFNCKKGQTFAHLILQPNGQSIRIQGCIADIWDMDRDHPLHVLMKDYFAFDPPYGPLLRHIPHVMTIDPFSSFKRSVTFLHGSNKSITDILVNAPRKIFE